MNTEEESSNPHSNRSAAAEEMAGLSQLMRDAARSEKRNRNWGVGFAMLSLLALVVLAGYAKDYATDIQDLKRKKADLTEEIAELDATKKRQTSELTEQKKQYRQLEVGRDWEVARLNKVNEQLTPSASIEAALTPKASFRRLAGELTAGGKQKYEFQLWLEIPEERRDEIGWASYTFKNKHYVKRAEKSVNSEDGFCVKRIVWDCLPTVEVAIALTNGSRRTRTFDMCELSGWSSGFVRVGSGTDLATMTSWASILTDRGFDAKIFETERPAEKYLAILGPFPANKTEVALQGWKAAGEGNKGIVTSGRQFTARLYPEPHACDATESATVDETSETIVEKQSPLPVRTQPSKPPGKNPSPSLPPRLKPKPKSKPKSSNGRSYLNAPY